MLVCSVTSVLFLVVFRDRIAYKSIVINMFRVFLLFRVFPLIPLASPNGIYLPKYIPL